MNDGEKKTGIRAKAEALFIIGLVVTAIIAMSDFTILGRDFGTDSWKSQYPWANSYETDQVNSINYDIVLEYRPWFEFARSEVLSGHVPLWNPYSFTGTPLYANHLCPVFYPPFTLSLLLFDEDAIAGCLAVLHLIIFGIALYFFLRILNIDPWPAFITAAAAQFTGICFVLWSPWASAVVWTPAILAFYETYRQTRDRRNIAWAGLIYGVMAMAAFPIIAVQFTYFLGIYIIIREVSAPGRKLRNIFISFLGIVVLGGTISGVQNIPTAIYALDTYRSVKFAHSVAFHNPAPPEGAMDPEVRPDTSPTEQAILARGRFVTPVAQLRTYSNKDFIGAPILLFAVVGLFLLPRGKRHWFYLFIIFLLISFVDSLYMFLMKVLPLWKIREYQPRELWHLTCLVCAGYGIQGLFEHSAARLRAPFKGLLVVFAIMLMAFVAVALTIEARTASRLFPLDPGIIEATGIQYAASLGLIVLVVFTLLFGLKIRLHYFITILLIAIILGGVPSRMLALPYTSNVPTFTPPPTEFIATMEKFTGANHRVARVTSKEYYLNFDKRNKVPFLANLTTIYRIRDISGYDSLVTKRTVDYINLVQEYSFKSLRTHISFTDPDVVTRDIFRSLAVGCIISDMDQLPVPTNVVQFGDIYLHRLKEPGVPYYLSRDVYVRQNTERVKIDIMHDGWLDAGEVFIDDEKLSYDELAVIQRIQPSGSEAGTIAFLDETSTRVKFEVNAVAPCIMVLNDAYAPGWEVRIDGMKTKCMSANLLFRAAYVPRGKHTVEFVYRPSYMAWGWLSTIAGLAFFVLLVLKKPRP